jgi:hypothetical protein
MLRKNPNMLIKMLHNERDQIKLSDLRCKSTSLVEKENLNKE